MESVSVSGISLSCKESKSIWLQIPRNGPRFLQSNDNKLRPKSIEQQGWQAHETTLPTALSIIHQIVRDPDEYIVSMI